MIAGVCNGLASYLAIDVTFVRIAFVLVAALSKGFGIIIYVAMMFIVPEARTGEERAAAGGAPFNAKEVIDRAKKQAAEGARHCGGNGASSSGSGGVTAGRPERRRATTCRPGPSRSCHCLRSCISPCS